MRRHFGATCPPVQVEDELQTPKLCSRVNNHTHRERKSITEDLITVSVHRHASGEETRCFLVMLFALSSLSLLFPSHIKSLAGLQQVQVCSLGRRAGLLKGILGNVGTTCTALNIKCLIEELFACCLFWTFLQTSWDRREGRRPWKSWDDPEAHGFGSSHRWTGSEVTGDGVSWLGVRGGQGDKQLHSAII